MLRFTWASQDKELEMVDYIILMRNEQANKYT